MKIMLAICLSCCSLKLFAEEISMSVHAENLKPMIGWYLTGHRPYPAMPKVDYVKDYMKSNHLSEEFMAEVVIDMIRTSLVARATGKSTKEFARGTIIGESYAITYLSRYRTTNAIQFLQSMCMSTNKFYRREALLGYIRSAKLDSLPTLKKCVQIGLMDEYDTYTNYKYFAYEIGQAEAEKQDGKKINEAKAFLLERAQEEKRRSAANELDKILCGMFPDYATSVQREKVAAHFMNDDNEICRKQFTKIHEDILKTPKDKRKDFRAKGELLDPVRKRNVSDVQP